MCKDPRHLYYESRRTPVSASLSEAQANWLVTNLPSQLRIDSSFPSRVPVPPLDIRWQELNCSRPTKYLGRDQVNRILTSGSRFVVPGRAHLPERDGEAHIGVSLVARSHGCISLVVRHALDGGWCR
jgi:hypothetical protein